MRKLVLAASIALLSACAAPQQEQINFTPQASLSNSEAVRGTAFTLVSKDARAAQYVALVNNGRSNIEPVHARQNIRIAIENALSEQFASQGYHLTVNSENRVTLKIEEALVNVKMGVMDNQMDAKVTLELTAETPKGKLVKTYKGTANRSGLLSASNSDIELVLNDVTNLVMKEIANDNELKSYMQERF